MLGLFGKRRSIQITVAAHGIATRFVKAGTYEVKEGSTVKAVLAQAGFSAGSVPLVFMIEGRKVDPGRKLQGGETVNVFQIAGGG